MGGINRRRVLYGGLLGGLVLNLWSILIEAGALGAERYAAAQQAGTFLANPRYPYFIGVWMLALFGVGYVLAWVYASVRATHGAGPKTAAKVGVAIGFAAGFPVNFAQAAWSTYDRMFPFAWTIELWVGAVLAALAAGWMYRE